MKIDLYTKICLTIIAISLSALAIKGVSPIKEVIAKQLEYDPKFKYKKPNASGPSYFKGKLRVYDGESDAQLNEVISKLWKIEQAIINLNNS